MKTKTLALLLAAAMLLLLTLAACSESSAATQPPESPPASQTPASPSASTPTTESATQAPATQSPATIEPAPASEPITADREGNPIALPDNIDTIISMGPSNTELIVALGFGDKIIAIDEYSFDVPGVKGDLPMFSMRSPDGEQIINLEPDVIIVTGMTKAGGADDPFQVVTEAGICVVYVPSSNSINGIYEDIRFMAAVLGAYERGEEIVTEMEDEIEAVRAIGSTITDKKTVYFEISAAPWMYSFGSGVFLNEMIELIGAVNILADQEAWISVADEAILDANPDVILTSVNYIDDPIDEILSRDGWNEITAIQNEDVFYIDTNSSNRPNQNIIQALLEMAKAVYPDKY